MKSINYIPKRHPVLNTFIYILLLFTTYCLPIVVQSAYAEEIIMSDSAFISDNWTVHELSTFGASQISAQVSVGGNPGSYRFMEHFLPEPDSSGMLCEIEVVHIYAIESYNPGTQGAIISIDYSEDIKLLNLPWTYAFITSMLVCEQDGKLYYALPFVQIIADTTWTTQSVTNLTASSFRAFDESRDKPNFTFFGSPIRFGYYRASSRFRNSPVPDIPMLMIMHGIDNWKVKIYNDPDNNPPIAIDDTLVIPYMDLVDSLRFDYKIFPLENDIDPEGHPVHIDTFEQAQYGDVWRYKYNPRCLIYFNDDHKHYDDEFNYTMSDGEYSDVGTVHVYACACIVRALFDPMCWEEELSKALVASVEQDTDLVTLFQRIRDEVLQTTENGLHYIDVFYENTIEITKIIMIDKPELRDPAISSLKMMKEPLQNLLDGDGEAVISQALIDSIKSFLTGIATAGSSELQKTITEEMTRLGPLDNYVGKSVTEVKKQIIGDSSSVITIKNTTKLPENFKLHQNFPNPFNPGTKIEYEVKESCRINLVIYNLNGQIVRQPVNVYQKPGKYIININMKELPSGLYFYKIQMGDFQAVKKMVLLK